MTTISGTWRINANGSHGLLTLASNDNASFQGSVTFEDFGGPTDRVTGNWNDVAGQITFTRFLSTGNTQTYTGVLGDNHPENLILAGSFASTDTPAISGWVAAPLQPAVTYLLSLDAFHCNQTRDTLTIDFPQIRGQDTDYAVLSIQVLSQVGYEAVFPLKEQIGKVHGGEDHPTPNLQFAIRLQPNEALAFSYLIMNSAVGSGAQQLQQFFDKVSAATRDALNIIYPAEKSIWEVGNKLTESLNKLQFSGCDGIVAGDKLTKTAAELNQLMPASGNRHSETRRYNSYQSQPVCRTPDYTVTWSLTRQ